MCVEEPRKKPMPKKMIPKIQEKFLTLSSLEVVCAVVGVVGSTEEFPVFGVEGPSGLASEAEAFVADDDDSPETGRFLGFFVRVFAFFSEIADVDFGVVASPVVGFISTQCFKPI